MLLSAVLFLAQLKSAPPPADKAFTDASRIATEARTANLIDDAIAAYKKAVALKPAWAEGWWYLGTLYYDADRYQEGRDAFRRLIVIDPKLAPAAALLGLCEFQTKDYEMSLAHLRQARALGIERNPELTAVAMYHTAILMTRFEHYEDAMAILAELARRGKDDSTVVTAMGLAAMRRKMLPTELPADDHDLIDMAGNAEILVAHRKSQDAAKVFEALIAKYPTTPNVHGLYAYFLLGSDPAHAVLELREELKLQPRNLPALLTLALEYLRQNDFDPGLQLAREAVKVDFTSFAAHNVLGRILVAKDELNEGIKELETARRIAPDSPQTHIALASAYAKAGRNDEAAKSRAEFLRLRKIVEGEGEPKP
jgi:predicted Zn-dependent protease